MKIDSKRFEKKPFKDEFGWGKILNVDRGNSRTIEISNLHSDDLGLGL